MITDTQRLDFLEKMTRGSRTGVSIDHVPRVEDEPSGFRVMWMHFVAAPAKKTLREAIDLAMKERTDVK